MLSSVAASILILCDRLGVLGLCLRDILAEIKPADSDRITRLNAINQFSDYLRSVQSLRGAVVKPFGSFVSNLYTKWGDLDVSVQLDNGLGNSASKTLKRSLLRDIMKALRRYGVARYIHFIPNARVPLLIYEGNHHNISFDVSIDNYLGIMKSKILLWISQMDERFRDVVLLTKEWAKAQNINDPKSGTLNSYSLCLMVIFHFQTCEPPILPPLGEIYGGNISDDVTGWSSISERHIGDVCAANIERFRSRNLRRRNQSSLAQLLVSFFDKFSEVETVASEYAICTHTGRWERIDSNLGWARTSRSMLIEDPFERPENAARTVGPSELRVVSNAFTDAYNKLSSSSVLANRNSLISCLTRSRVSSQLGVRPQVHYTTGTAAIDPAAVLGRFENVMRLDRRSHASTSAVTVSRRANETTYLL
ncbi:Zinc finger, CCHC domain containing [Musa troglodytarum]|uniref:Zinc finger, CCHC domain containing n=1 Tax=Musa troglodytarum TaxID=320322 RepID=A0A9E7G5C1_9LILI|nr:Zinc finger, CCHC domain containing [Musa troglodytarum]